jgi:hypothetical protein
MRGFINMLFLVVALESACYLCQVFNVFGGVVTYPFAYTSITNVADYFSFERLGFAMLIGGTGAAAVTIIGMLTRSGQYMLYALLIFGLGSFLPLISDFVLAAPNTIYAIIQATGISGVTVGTDPSTGASLTAWEPLAITVGLWAAVWGALFVFGLIFQRDMHT